MLDPAFAGLLETLERLATQAATAPACTEGCLWRKAPWRHVCTCGNKAQRQAARIMLNAAVRPDTVLLLVKKLRALDAVLSVRRGETRNT